MNTSFGMGTSILRYVPSPMSVVVGQGELIRTLPGLKFGFAEFRLENRGFELIILPVANLFRSELTCSGWNQLVI